MGFWPQKRWKKIALSILLIVLAVLGGIGVYLEYSVYREIATPLEVLNAEGSKTALVIYHPGLTAFSQNVSYSFANGLAANGWCVEIATASTQAPTNLSSYSLLVLGWPIYDFNPGPTITNLVGRLGNLQGIDTVVLFIGGGLNPLDAQGKMNKIVQDANGTVIQTVQAFRGGNVWSVIEEQAGKILP